MTTKSLAKPTQEEIAKSITSSLATIVSRLSEINDQMNLRPDKSNMLSLDTLGKNYIWQDPKNVQAIRIKYALNGNVYDIAVSIRRERQ